MDVDRPHQDAGVNAEIQPRGPGVNVDMRHQQGVNVEMQDESHSHSDDDNQMESESDSDEDAPPAPLLPPGNLNRPNFRPPFPPNVGPQFPQQRRARGPPMQFPGMPPLGGEEIFGGEGHKLGGKEVAVLGDAQLMEAEGGQSVCQCVCLGS